ncbi:MULTISPECIES: protein phosphatase CheZ [Comamonas]|jgi:chemotaxis protein CheZ|uniref:protein phosphatase CheZ n=1 Tax=Comamonas TaxID=283 RepID=UPI0012D25B02|nr:MULTISPECIES: protein phosphatase CheZ [Comamonas]MDR3065338.1 protein phosphatase CheZ [Comamonas sp.]MEB5966759.1 protein phosphatase CheZ [Comamonas testosteroni]MPS93898.1 protein phosphatase CheZ [Comamonas sp.]
MSSDQASANVHYKIGVLTRQLHNSLNELGYADRLRGSAGELPDAQSRLSYIARLTGEAADKVLGQVEVTQSHQDALAERTRSMRAELIQDPVAAVAKGRVMNYLQEVEEATERTNSHLTEIMMAQDFHDLTGQVIARVVALAADLESQLLELLIQTSPDVAQAPVLAPVEALQPKLAGPVVDPEKTADVVTSQSQVDDLLASLGF